jgi:hypothetical protein
MKGSVSNWSITKIFCTKWGDSSSTAVIWANNWANDELNFEIAIHPDDYLVFYSVDVDFHSGELSTFQANQIIETQLLAEAESLLDEWWLEVESACRYMSQKDWEKPRGYAVSDLQYARLAQLYSLRARYAPLNITKLLSEDMSVPMTTTKERIRKAREKGFLTSPGRGLNGQGEITRKAIQLLKKEGSS